MMPEQPAFYPHMTMQDVARRAGVSAQTVSNVVNGRSDRVGEATTQRVIDAINGLGYRLNQSARSLRRGRTGIIGLGLPILSSRYYSELADRLAARFTDAGFRLAIERTGGALDAELDSLAASNLESYDGYVLGLAASEAPNLDRLSPSKPIVLLGERAISQKFDHVLMDNVAGARAATLHLFERGARTVLALGGSSASGDSVQTLRARGYIAAHAEAGVAMDPRRIIDGGLGMRDGYRTLSRILEEGSLQFDAIFALTDDCAFGAMRALSEHGLSVPDDVQLIGFDNVRAGAYATPTLSTVEPGNDEMADKVVELMLRRLGGTALAAPTIYTARTEIIPRESTRPL